MMKSIFAEATPRTDSWYQAEIDRMLVEIEAKHNEMFGSHQRFEDSYSRTQQALTETEKILKRLSSR